MPRKSHRSPRNPQHPKKQTGMNLNGNIATQIGGVKMSASTGCIRNEHYGKRISPY